MWVTNDESEGWKSCEREKIGVMAWKQGTNGGVFFNVNADTKWLYICERHQICLSDHWNAPLMYPSLSVSTRSNMCFTMLWRRAPTQEWEEVAVGNTSKMTDGMRIKQDVHLHKQEIVKCQWCEGMRYEDRLIQRTDWHRKYILECLEHRVEIGRIRTVNCE